MADFSKLQAYIDRMHKQWGTPACDVAVYLKGVHGWNTLHAGMHNPIRDLTYEVLGI